MEVPGIGTAAGGSPASVAATTLADNFDTFLTLLTTQLQNQDPLDPLDSNEFTQQLVQFSGVEQSIATNKNLEKLIGLIGAGQSADLLNYLGTSVNAVGDTALLGTTGPVTWGYALAAPAEATQLVVSDATGKVVFTTDGATAVGGQQFVWDGTDNVGAALPPGLYSLAVTAVSADGQSITTKTSVTGTVTGLETADGATNLVVNGTSVPLDDVLSVNVAGTL